MTAYVEICTQCGYEEKIKFATGWEEEWTNAGDCSVCKGGSMWELYSLEGKGRRRLVSGVVKTPAVKKEEELREKLEKQLARLKKDVAELRKENAALKKENASLVKDKKAAGTANEKMVALRNEVKELKKQVGKSREKPSPQKPAKKPRKEAKPDDEQRPPLTKKITIKDLTEHYEPQELRVFALVNGFDEQCANKRFQALAYDIWMFLTKGVRPLPREFISPEKLIVKKPPARRKPKEDEEEEEEEEPEKCEERESSVVREEELKPGKGGGDVAAAGAES